MTSHRMSGNKRRKAKTSLKGTVIVLFLVIILALIFLIAAGGSAYHSSKENQEEIGKSIQTLQDLEAKTPTTFKQNQPVEAIDTESEQEKINTMNESTETDVLRKWYQGTAIVGDSITMAAAEYGYLDYTVVCAKIGAFLADSEDLFNQAIALHPYVVFLCFGMNDIGGYLENYNMFIDEYKKQISMLKTALPEATFYVHSIFPAQPGYGEAGYEYRNEYNAALEKMCSEIDGVYYIDSSFILDNDPSLFDLDGIHPTAAFYPKWLTYMADVAGLSKEDGN